MAVSFMIVLTQYTLEVWDPPKGPPTRFRITVYVQPWTDIASIALRPR